MTVGERYIVRLKDVLTTAPQHNYSIPERADGSTLPLINDMLVEVLETSDGLIMCPGSSMVGVAMGDSSAGSQGEEPPLVQAGMEVLLRRITSLENDINRKDKEFKTARMRNNDLMRKNDKLSDRLLKYVDKVLKKKEETESS